jgi:hypothetical protein
VLGFVHSVGRTNITLKKPQCKQEPVSIHYSERRYLQILFRHDTESGHIADHHSFEAPNERMPATISGNTLK